MLENVLIECAFCGEPFELEVDPSAGRRQVMFEDCWVCCQPNQVSVLLADDGSVERVTVERS